MIALCWLLAALLVMPSVASATDAFIGVETVRFDSAAYEHPPSAFRIKQAAKRGEVAKGRVEPAVPIEGFLARPAGEGPRPAMVLMHTCAGLSEHERHWSDRLVEWGYVVLTVDSFGPRGITTVCDGRPGSIGPRERALDAYGARRVLAALPGVDADRIGIIGFSHGAMTVLEALAREMSDGLGDPPFHAGVAFYPYCGKAPALNAPLLILSGSEDSWTPAALCAAYADGASDPVELVVFEGAHHLFDHPGIDIVEVGFVLRSDPRAAREASVRVREHLER